ncbi:MAG: hypothetical protein KDB26_06825, partial [Microthrixaceae bacterium]|nr:hypothetical protein [Microthrixaceae bacterium]
VLIAMSAALGVVALACTPPDEGPPPSTTPPTSASALALDRAGDWIAGQFNASGFIPLASDPGASDTGAGVLAVATLASLDKAPAMAGLRLDSLESTFESYVDQGAGDRAGALARVILAVVASGGNPRDFGGTDLVARLESTQQPSGLFGSQYAGFDGAFRQGLALAALSVVTPRPASITPGSGQTINDVPAVAWLIDQQCDDASWLMFRADTTTDCVENPAMWVYKDSNGSALAALGLAAVGATPDHDPQDWFNAVRGNDGGWGASPSGPTQVSDSNSTGLVIAALRALGHTPDQTAIDTLISFQIQSPATDHGAFVWRLDSVGVIRMSTLDAVVGLYERPWPGALVN